VTPTLRVLTRRLRQIIFPSHGKALIRTVREEGVGALYKGMLPNILRGMSMNVGMMACYDQAKEVIASMMGDPMTNGPSLATRLGASATAGFTAALFSMPFDLVKSRLMAMKPDPMTGEMPYKVRRDRRDVTFSPLFVSCTTCWFGRI
jgi:hypothetical protein